MKKSQSDESYVIQDLETLRVVSDPIRAQILEILVDHKFPVREVAEKLGLSASKLYYHFNLLEKHGLIQVIETRQVANLLEKWYTATATYLSVDPRLLTFSAGSGNEALVSVVQTVIDATREDLVRSFQARAHQLASGASEKPRKAIINRVVSYLDEEKVAELQERLKALIDEFTEADRGDQDADESTHLYAMTVAFYPSFYFQPADQLQTLEDEEKNE